MRVWLLCLCGGVAALLPATAVAMPSAPAAGAAPSSDAVSAPGGRDAERRGAAPADVSASYFMGVFNGGAGLNFGGAALVRAHVVDVGAEGSIGGELFGYGYSALAGDAGVAWHARRRGGFRFDLLGALGADSYGGVGRSILSSDPGASATLPFAGARLIAGYAYFRGTAHLELAARGFFDDDLTRRTVAYDYTETAWGGAFPTHISHRVGTWRSGVAFDLICTWDL